MKTKADATLKWVRRLNAIAAKLDEACRGVHPSAWPELIAKHKAEWKALAQRGPTGNLTKKNRRGII